MISNENVVKEQNISNENVEIITRWQDPTIEELKKQLQQKENIIKEIKAQLYYLETYSSKEDVFEDMKRKLDRIEKILGDSSNE